MMSLRTLTVIGIAASTVFVRAISVHSSMVPRATLEPIATNDNRTPAGILGDSVLTLHLELRGGLWRPDQESQPGIEVHAFAEEGKPAVVPGPLIRVREGTAIHATVRNTLRDSTLILHGFSPRGVNGRGGADTIQVRPGEVREMRFDAGKAGTYFYWGTTSREGQPPSDAELSGAFIIDPRGSEPPRDRVFVISLWNPSLTPAAALGRNELIRFTINGKSWPNTERLTYTVGDTVRFRLVNTSVLPHPMHLHGFYFNVDSRGDGTIDSALNVGGASPYAVTERVAPGRTFSLTWVPSRPGFWMFHCHNNFHVLRNRALDGSALPDEGSAANHAKNHALEMMGGLVMGVEVKPKDGRATTESALGARRRLRLIARVDSGGTEAQPSYGYALQEVNKPIQASRPLLPGPVILLKRGEPVSITVVNELPEPTAVHWHGIELDSYYDGVAGFAGHPGHIAPAIAPRDSFEARFTPPRSGTFIYHPHADEVRQQQAGLSGAIVVVDSLAGFDPERDLVLLISVPRLDADGAAVLLNGTLAPPLREFRVGTRYRLRLINIHTYRPSMIARLMRDSTLVTWRAVAKDGRDLPADQATERQASQQMGNGETYDFEFTPNAPGDMRLTVSAAAGALLVTMPIRVR